MSKATDAALAAYLNFKKEYELLPFDASNVQWGAALGKMHGALVAYTDAVQAEASKDAQEAR